MSTEKHRLKLGESAVILLNMDHHQDTDRESKIVRVEASLKEIGAVPLTPSSYFLAWARMNDLERTLSEIEGQLGVGDAVFVIHGGGVPLEGEFRMRLDEKKKGIRIESDDPELSVVAADHPKRAP